jgi:hypothetical protein
MKITYLKCCLLVLAAFTWLNSNAQDKKLSKDLYIAATIPDSLKENANSVVRYASEEMNIKAAGKVLTRCHSITTILNDKGDNDASLALPYDRKFNSISDVEIIVYNALGIPVKKYHKSDMYDRSATDGVSIITDNRVLYWSHSIASYPSTVEVSYQIDMNSYLDLGQWQYQEPEKAIQFSEYKVIANPAVGFRYKNKNTVIKPVKTTEEGMDKYVWQVSNIKAIKPEDDALSWRVFPKVIFAANAFKFDGIPGDISTWQNYGKWYQALNADVCSLTPQRSEEIQKLTADLKTDNEKAKFLYGYMQQSMRYVSVQLGIGGLKPFPATFVDQKKYGDCKALSNYMYALLKAVNIPSYYAIVQGGTNDEPADAAFPADPFNHVILCIPFKGDTTWLECTSSTQPYGKLGSFTENRNALLITENGGLLVNTPKSTIQDNQFNSEVHMTLNADGSAKVNIKILGTGGYRNTYLDLASLKTDEQKQFLIKYHRMKQPSAFEIKSADDKDGVKEFDMDLEYDKFYEIAAGDKHFYRPRAFDIWALTCPVLEKRKSDYYFDHPMQKACVTTIDLPAGFEVETLPANQALKFSYGNYEVNYTYNAAKNQVISTAKFNLTNQVIPAAKYTEMQQYMDNIAKAQNKKLVIRRKA